MCSSALAHLTLHYHLSVHVHLQTGRLTLRRFNAADEDNLVGLNGDSGVMRYITTDRPARDRLTLGRRRGPVT